MIFAFALVSGLTGGREFMLLAKGSRGTVFDNGNVFAGEFMLAWEGI